MLYRLLFLLGVPQARIVTLETVVVVFAFVPLGGTLRMLAGDERMPGVPWRLLLLLLAAVAYFEGVVVVEWASRRFFCRSAAKLELLPLPSSRPGVAMIPAVRGRYGELPDSPTACSETVNARLLRSGCPYSGDRWRMALNLRLTVEFILVV